MSTPSNDPTDIVINGDVGRGSIEAGPDTPGGCSATFTLSGEVVRLPAESRTLWLVALLYKSPPLGNIDDLYYPKGRIPSNLGDFSTSIVANTTPGVRVNRYLLVVANEEADAELQLSFDSDQQRDDRYPDGSRVQLPSGAEQIAMTPDIEQRC